MIHSMTCCHAPGVDPGGVSMGSEDFGYMLVDLCDSSSRSVKLVLAVAKP